MPDTALVIIARPPELGRVKTRLAAGIGPTAALAVYGQLLRIVAATQAGWSGPVLLYADGDHAAWAGSGLDHLPRRRQTAGDLGCRIADALRWGLSSAERAIAIGTDCPGLEVRHLQRLDQALAAAPVAFGPAVDGGYWGVAVSEARPIPCVSEATLPWSTQHLLQATCGRLAEAGIPWTTGDTLADCDDADDLAVAAAAGLLTWPHPIGINPC